MSDLFVPSIDRAAAEGVRVTRVEYPAGPGGPKLTIAQIGQRIREGMADKDVQGWAFDQLIAAGFNGRGEAAGSTRQRAAALLDAVRAVTLYAPDPPNLEMVKSARALLCLRPNLCIRGGDCDDLLVLLGSVLMSVGIPARILKQTFGAADQEHVLVEAQDENGNWFPMDPSTDYPAGQRAMATNEQRIDPTNPADTGSSAPEAEFVGVGALPGSRLDLDASGQLQNIVDIVDQYPYSVPIVPSRPLFTLISGGMRRVAGVKGDCDCTGVGASACACVRRAEEDLGRRPVGATPVGVGAGTRIIYPSDVVNRKNSIDAKVTSVSRDVDACKALKDTDRQAWVDFAAAWRKFYCLNADGQCSQPDYSIWSLGGQMDDLETWDANVYAWQQKLAAATCTLSAPVVAPPIPTAEQKGAGDEIAAVAKAVTSVAIVGIVGLVVWEGLKWLDIIRPSKASK